VVGYPKHLNTAADYEYVQQHFPREQWGADYQRLLDAQKTWINKGLVAAEAGVTSKTQKVVVSEATDGAKAVEHYQYVYEADPGCKLARLGMAAADVEKVLAG
jgi:hypothetical protein